MPNMHSMITPYIWYGLLLACAIVLIAKTVVLEKGTGSPWWCDDILVKTCSRDG